MTIATESNEPHFTERSVPIYWKLFDLLLVVGILAAGWYFRDVLVSAWRSFEQAYLPCRSPVAYDIGSVDERFGLPESEVFDALKLAEEAWEKPIGRDLFVRGGADAMKINLVYDYRQEATDTLGNMGLSIKSDRSSYDSLKETYLAAKAEFDRNKSDYEADKAAFDARRAAFEKDVEYWNARGGASAGQYEKLGAERDAINLEADRLNTEVTALNAEAARANAMVTALNELAADLNIQAEEFNEVAGSRGQEFQEGQYRLEGGVQTIDIFEFDGKEQLISVLIHEFGHALGLEHSDNSGDVMYRLNEGSGGDGTVSEGDIQALKARCGIK
jgi:hypothetical protein